MATLANAAGSSFVQQQRQISVETTAAAAVSTSTTIPDSSSISLTSSSSTSSTSSSSSPLCSSTSSSCESGVVLSGSSICSSLTNSQTSTSSSTANTGTVKFVTASSPSASTTSLAGGCLLPASLLAVAVSSTSTPSQAETTISLSSSLSLPLSSSSTSSYTPNSTVTATSPESLQFVPTTKQSLVGNVAATSSNTSAHQLLLNGLSVSDADLNNAVNSSSLVEDPRALQLALELSMVGLNDSVHLQVQQQQQQQQQLQLQQLQQQHLQHIQQQQQQLSQQHHQQQSSFDMSALSAAVAAAAAVANGQAPTHSSTASQLNQFSSTILPGIEDRSKKSQNMTECVPVPSSEHVAEIVGRQGCKIKALRAKTNTYIKTPVRGEEPVFVVTGRKEDVAKAKREILSAAEHFSVIRASRKPSLAGSLTGSLNGTGNSAKSPPGPPAIPGQVTIQVRVPYRVVGLVVGPKGATIKHIQQETQTYIVTPSREKEPIFEVTGLPDNVQAARKQIEAHIALRTGNLSTPAGDANTAAASNGTGTVHTINSLSQILSDEVSPEFLASIYKNGLCSTFDYADGCISSVNTVPALPVSTNNMGINLNLTACSASQSLINDMTSSMSTANNFQLPSGANINNDYLCSMINRGVVDGLNGHQVYGGVLNLNSNNSSGNVANGSILNSTATAINLNGNISQNSVANGIGMSRSCSSASSTTSSKSANNSGGSNSSRPELTNIWKNLSDSLDVDEGIGESPSIWTLPSSLATLSSHYSPATSISPTDSLLGESNSLGQLLATQTQQQQRTTVSLNSSTNGTIMMQQPHTFNHNHHNLGVRRECLICGDKEVTAALVPCGHNMFCMECANRICSSPEGTCPVCSQSVFHAMRILP